MHSPIIPTLNSIFLRKAAKASHPSHSSYTRSHYCIFHGINIVWEQRHCQSSNASAVSDLLAKNLLTKLEKSISNLPKTLPDTSDSDEIAVFTQSIPTNMDRDDAWEFLLDPLLNCFLGFRRTIESISASLRGGEKGLTAMARYLQEFVGHYQIDGALLEGKVLQLIEAIESQCQCMAH